MPSPNLFEFATSELSQDAFVCWLLSWADPSCRSLDEALHRTGTALLDKLLDLGKKRRPPAYESVRIRRQYKRIDVLVVVNSAIAIIIEDKTDTTDHSGQLKRYKEAVRVEFPDEEIVAIYLKTGDQSHYKQIEEAGYAPFRRRDFLGILEEGARLGVKNDIFRDYQRSLLKIEEAVNSYKIVPVQEWNSDWRRWAGFFMALQERLENGGWGYVPNPSGGFMGFWWPWQGDKYLQLEMDSLCFKITVEDSALRTAKWKEWHQMLTAESGNFGLTFQKTRRRSGRWMTVTAVDGDYRQTDQQGILDFERTMLVLEKAQGLLDAAAKRLQG